MIPLFDTTLWYIMAPKAKVKGKAAKAKGNGKAPKAKVKGKATKAKGTGKAPKAKVRSGFYSGAFHDQTGKAEVAFQQHLDTSSRHSRARATLELLSKDDLDFIIPKLSLV